MEEQGIKANVIDHETWIDVARQQEVPGLVSILECDGVTGLGINCPGCGKESYLHLTDENGRGLEPCWHWDGDPKKPTLKPSVHSVGCCGWHGYLRNGIWESIEK